MQADIGTAAGVQDVIRRIQQEWGGLDILVNNAGGSDAPNGGFQALSDVTGRRPSTSTCWQPFVWIARFFPA